MRPGDFLVKAAPLVIMALALLVGVHYVEKRHQVQNQVRKFDSSRSMSSVVCVTYVDVRGDETPAPGYEEACRIYAAK